MAAGCSPQREHAHLADAPRIAGTMTRRRSATASARRAERPTASRSTSAIEPKRSPRLPARRARRRGARPTLGRGACHRIFGCARAGQRGPRFGARLDRSEARLRASRQKRRRLAWKRPRPRIGACKEEALTRRVPKRVEGHEREQQVAPALAQRKRGGVRGAGGDEARIDDGRPVRWRRGGGGGRAVLGGRRGGHRARWQRPRSVRRGQEVEGGDGEPRRAQATGAIRQEPAEHRAG